MSTITCHACHGTTNTAVCNHLQPRRSDGMANECYAKWDGSRWVEGCAYARCDRYTKPSVDRLLGRKRRASRHRCIISVGTRLCDRKSKEASPAGWVKRRVQQLRARPTRAEACIRAKLEAAEIEHVFQAGWVGPAGMFAIFDFVLPRDGLIIEVDGGYHTNEERTVMDASRDWFTTRVLKMDVVRLTNEEAMMISVERLADEVHRHRTRRLSDVMSVLID